MTWFGLWGSGEAVAIGAVLYVILATRRDMRGRGPAWLIAAAGNVTSSAGFANSHDWIAAAAAVVSVLVCLCGWLYWRLSVRRWRELARRGQ